MCKDPIKINMGFADEQFPAGIHMCMIYNSEKERQKIISKYLEAGLSTGEKVAYFAAEMSPEQIREWLVEMGIKIHDFEKTGSFKVTSAAETYYPTGRFEPEEMLNNLKRFYETAKDEHYPASRVTGEMVWALKGVPGSDRLMEYESKLNDLLAEYPVAAMCQYDANKFDGAIILDCLKVHPYMIVHGQIVRNPYYMKTDEFLKELAVR